MGKRGDAPECDGDNSVCFTRQLWLHFDGIPSADSPPYSDGAKTQSKDGHQTEH